MTKDKRSGAAKPDTAPGARGRKASCPAEARTLCWPHSDPLLIELTPVRRGTRLMLNSSELLALLSLLDNALDLPSSQRATWLAELRRAQPTRAARLEAMLLSETRLDHVGFLVDSPELPATPAIPLAGLRLGPYTLERLLGRGGMGTVWLGRRSDGRYEGVAAVKLLNLALLDEAGAARFRREGTVLARLSHPHIARLLDAGVTEAGQPYLVLEYVEGSGSTPTATPVG